MHRSYTDFFVQLQNNENWHWDTYPECFMVPWCFELGLVQTNLWTNA